MENKQEQQKTKCPNCGSVESADTILKGFVVYYNFIRKHQGINCSPFELATDVKLNNPNRWMDLIELSQNL